MLQTNSTDDLVTVRTTERRGVPVVAVTGEVDSTTAWPMRSGLLDELDRGPRRLVVDLSGVRFIGSTGLRVLVEAIDRAQARGTAFAVAAGHRAVLMPMRITELDREVAVRPTVEDAVAAVLAP
ncbi:STAS domain-containing protein [Actinosynnema sp. NPDC053489]|uniref:STAS domain-containing protein n=1 Tax=Actinosynnema sp. NPDC053489 TaxID=3363916 RepID=UPI0037C78EF2